jgi:hypothetical protein
MSPRTTRSDSFPDLGIIQDYNAERGFGYVRSILEQELYFFHITSLGESLLKRRMISGQTTYRGVYFSYVVKKTEKGYAAFSLQVPSAMEGDHLCNFIDRIKSGLRLPVYAYDPVDLNLLLSLLVTSSETTDEDLSELMCSSFSECHLKDLIEVLPASRLERIGSKIDFETFWLDTSSSLPSWLPPVTSLLCGDTELVRLSDCRDASVRERAEFQEAAKRERWEELKAARRRRLAKAVEKYRTDPAGIRDSAFMADVCLLCASDDVESIDEGFGPNRQCRICDSSWYVNHCWNCFSGKVDSRDPPPCPTCKWLKCAKCDACTDSRSGRPRLPCLPPYDWEAAS